MTELEKVKAERDELARHLFRVMHDLHPVYSSTAGPHGGIGGRAMTQWCHVTNPHTSKHESIFYDADGAWREQFRRAEREGYSLLSGQ